MYSSTEGDAGMVYVMHFKRNLASHVLGIGGVKGDFIVESWTKTVTRPGRVSNVYGSRAVHKF